MGLTGPRCQQSNFLLKALGGNLFHCLFQLLEIAYISWLMASYTIFKAQSIASSSFPVSLFPSSHLLCLSYHPISLIRTAVITLAPPGNPGLSPHFKILKYNCKPLVPCQVTHSQLRGHGHLWEAIIMSSTFTFTCRVQVHFEFIHLQYLDAFSICHDGCLSSSAYVSQSLSHLK